jgi:hypothetical protein
MKATFGTGLRGKFPGRFGSRVVQAPPVTQKKRIGKSSEWVAEEIQRLIKN